MRPARARRPPYTPLPRRIIDPSGSYGVLEVFIDTIIICTLTGIAILSGGEEIWASGETGIYLTFLAFRQSFGNIGMWVAGIAVFLFCYSSYLGYLSNSAPA
jgi:AGCS family alanine or glycine:cation symporter